MTFLESLKSMREVELSVKRSGKWTTRPVWFVEDAATVFLLPMYGTDTKWYKYAAANPEIELSVRDKRVRGVAKRVLNEQELAGVIERFQTKYGDLKRYYKKIDVAIAVRV